MEVTRGATRVEIAVSFSSLEEAMPVSRNRCHCAPFIFWILEHKSKMCAFNYLCSSSALWGTP